MVLDLLDSAGVEHKVQTATETSPFTFHDICIAQVLAPVMTPLGGIRAEIAGNSIS